MQGLPPDPDWQSSVNIHPRQSAWLGEAAESPLRCAMAGTAITGCEDRDRLAYCQKPVCAYGMSVMVLSV